VLKALHAGGRAAALALLDGVEAELRAAMLLTGCADLASLRRAPKILRGEIATWLAELG
jgi:isopentenyl diphosphate isomerase/L-lactate dehydrogenase-like FMN-dependent dehydrogenase